MSELLDCPFCGSEAEWGKGKHGDGTDWDYIACSKCEAIGPSASVQREGNILDWNQRQPHPDSESISESLRFWIATRINKASVSMASSGYEDNELVKAFDSVCESIQQAMEQEK